MRGSLMSYKSRKDILDWGERIYKSMKLKDDLRNYVRVIASSNFKMQSVWI